MKGDTMALLKAEHVTKQYGGRTIIKDINIELHRGELVSLLGVSGSGKTTLFHVLSGLIAPEEGRVFLEGEDITAHPGKISYMMQKDLLLPHKKIIDNVSLPLVLHGTRKKKPERRQIRCSRNLDWMEPSTSIHASYPGECVREQRCSGPTFPRVASPFWTNPSVPWIPSQNLRFIDGIWMLWNTLICPLCLLLTILTRPFCFRIASIF